MSLISQLGNITKDIYLITVSLGLFGFYFVLLYRMSLHDEKFL